MSLCDFQAVQFIQFQCQMMSMTCRTKLQKQCVNWQRRAGARWGAAAAGAWGEQKPLNKQKADSREPSGEKDQDTGDLFFNCTSLTRYPLQVMQSDCVVYKIGRFLLGKLVLLSGIAGIISNQDMTFKYTCNIRIILHLIAGRDETYIMFQSYLVQP